MLKINKAQCKFVILSVFCMCLLFSMQAYASQPDEQSAKNAVEAFFDAGSHKDFNAMVSNSFDPQNTLSVRHQIFDKQIEGFLGYQIKSVQKLDSTHVIAIVEIRDENYTATMKYPVVFNGTKWLVDIANAENIVQDSSKGQKIVQPKGSLICQYGGIVSSGRPIQSASFTGDNRYDVQGYQVPTESGYAVSIEYQLQINNWIGWGIVRSKVVDGTWPESNWFPVITYDNLDPSATYRLNAVVNCMGPVEVAGNIWRP